MPVLASALALAACPAEARLQEAHSQAVSSVAPGDVVREELGKACARFVTPIRPKIGGLPQLLGHRYRVEVSEPGPVTFELRSHLFDPYLILRDGSGEILAEDNDGLVELHARIVFPDAQPGDELWIEACTRTDQSGDFELRVLRGEPTPLI